MGKIKRFPTFKATEVLKPMRPKVKVFLKHLYVKLFFPARLNAMAINPAAVCHNDEMKFTPGEVVVSIDKGIYTTIYVMNESGGQIQYGESVKRRSLVKHAVSMMQKALGTSPSLFIDVDDSKIIKHCGFSSSSCTIASVCSAINELYGNPLSERELIQYVVTNPG
jgi:uncharacterized protein involved in propanediol utilization